MSQSDAKQPTDLPSNQETYTHSYSDTHRQMLATRTAAVYAGFFLPHLRPDM